VIHLEIRTAKLDGEDCSPSDIVIDQRNITLGEALEMVIGHIWSLPSLANVGSRFMRARIHDPEGAELALFYEHYVGRSDQEYWDRIPESCYSFWYSFTGPERRADEQQFIGDDWSDFRSLYDALMVYALHFEGSERMRISPEVQRHINRRKCRSRLHVPA
jgi:hypothetical protein